MVPVIECRIPQVTVVSVTASPVVLTTSVGKSCARSILGVNSDAERAAPPAKTARRLRVLISGDFFVSVIMPPCRCNGRWVGTIVPLVSKLAGNAAMQYTLNDVYGWAFLPCTMVYVPGVLPMWLFA